MWVLLLHSHLRRYRSNLLLCIFFCLTFRYRMPTFCPSLETLVNDCIEAYLWHCQKLPPEVFCKKRFLYKFRKFDRETLVLESLFNKVAMIIFRSYFYFWKCELWASNDNFSFWNITCLNLVFSTNIFLIFTFLFSLNFCRFDQSKYRSCFSWLEAYHYTKTEVFH